MALKRIKFRHSHHLELDTKVWHYKDGFNMGAQAQLEADIKEHNIIIREIFEAGQILWVRADFASRLENAAVRAFVHEIGRDLQSLKQKYLA